MSLDIVLIKHLDDQEELETMIDEDIESMVNNLKIKDLMEDAELSLTTLVNDLQEHLKNEYYNKSAENGINLASDIEKDGDIKIQDSNDPNLNKDVLDGADSKS